jgi:hypothetical protein
LEPVQSFLFPFRKKAPEEQLARLRDWNCEEEREAERRASSEALQPHIVFNCLCAVVTRYQMPLAHLLQQRAG